MRLGQARVGGNVRELKPKRRWTRPLKWMGWGTVLVVLVLAAGRYGWGVYGDDVWARQVAPYTGAAKLLADDASHPRVSPAEDAATDLVAAAKEIAADPRGNWILRDADSATPLDDEQRVVAAGLIRRLDGVWAKLDAANGKTGANWHVDGDYERSLSQVDAITAFLRVAAQYYHQSGDDRRALACVRRVMRLAVIAGRAPDGYFEMTATYRSAARTVLQVAADLRVGTGDRAVSEADVRGLIAVMLDESEARPSLIRDLEYRRAVVVDDSAQCLAERFPRIYRLPTIVHEPWARRLLRPMIQTDTPLMLRQADQVLAAARLADDLPTLLSLAPDAGGLRVLREESMCLHLWAMTCWPQYEGNVRAHFATLVERRMAATALALRLYSIERGGGLPSRLDDLVPRWLLAVPGDPMAHGRTLSYRPKGRDPLLYSVGRDGIDDGGSEASPHAAWTADDGNWSRLWWQRDAVVHLRGPSAPNPIQ